jgi:hypothetical protein
MGVAMGRQERFEVTAIWTLSEVTQLVPNGGRLDEELRRLEDTFFDTSGAGLGCLESHYGGRSGVRRHAGSCRFSVGRLGRSCKSGSRVKSPPPPLAQAVKDLLAGQRLNPVAAIVTSRTAYRVLDADDQPVLKITDDQMESGPPSEESTLHSWRQVRLELGVAGKTKDLKRARKLLRAAGATVSSKIKLDKALGPVASNMGASTVNAASAVAG